MKKRIYYHDTDCEKVMYYGNYLKQFEEGRYEYMLACGIDLAQVSKQDTLFTIRRVEIDYKASASCGDYVTICSEIIECHRASLIFKQEMFKDDMLLASAKIDVVCVDKSFKPKAIPATIKDSLSK
ncbi:MAG: YbgC/FadM family acyl-CoA thioesterase [Candidatus Kappaea frigidicola]|nr:YbgC/FadM family acyl-CoA thioesterase [Candidatus Kappaea frigidicola]